MHISARQLGMQKREWIACRFYEVSASECQAEALVFADQRLLARYRRPSGATASPLTFACQRPRVHHGGARKLREFSGKVPRIVT